MTSKPFANKMRALLLLCVMTTSGCATKYSVTPASPAPKVSLTPLSQAVQQIDLQATESWYQKESNWRKKLDNYSGSETPK